MRAILLAPAHVGTRRCLRAARHTRALAGIPLSSTDTNRAEETRGTASGTRRQERSPLRRHAPDVRLLRLQPRHSVARRSPRISPPTDDHPELRTPPATPNLPRFQGQEGRVAPPRLEPPTWQSVLPLTAAVSSSRSAPAPPPTRRSEPTPTPRCRCGGFDPPRLHLGSTSSV